jgi:plastocyanin
VIPGFAIGRLAAAFALAAAIPAGTALAATHVVVIERMSFGAMPADIVAGDTIEWRNADPVPHTATAKAAGFDVALAPGSSGSVVVAGPGRYDVVCTYHPGMTATLQVEPRERGAP